MIKRSGQKSLNQAAIARHNQPAQADGFTIAELVITIVIMGIIIPAVALALTNLSVINYQARDLALSNMLAQNKVETLRSTGYNGIALGTQSFSSELPANMGSPKSASYTITSPQTGIKQ